MILRRLAELLPATLQRYVVWMRVLGIVGFLSWLVVLVAQMVA